MSWVLRGEILFSDCSGKTRSLFLSLHGIHLREERLLKLWSVSQGVFDIDSPASLDTHPTILDWLQTQTDQYWMVRRSCAECLIFQVVPRVFKWKIFFLEISCTVTQLEEQNWIKVYLFIVKWPRGRKIDNVNPRGWRTKKRESNLVSIYCESEKWNISRYEMWDNRVHSFEFRLSFDKFLSLSRRRWMYFDCISVTLRFL